MPLPVRLAGVAVLVLAAGPVVGQPAPQTPPAGATPGPAPGTEAADRLAALGATAPDAPPTPPTPPPYDGPFLERTNLFGDWLGARSQLRDHGVTWDISSANFYQGVTAGGLQRAFPFGGRGDMLLHVDGGKAGLRQGLFIDLHAETLYGLSANPLTGGVLPVSIGQSLPLPDESVTALTGVKFTQALSERVVGFFGKVNTADGYNQPFTGGALGVNGFWNTGLVIPPVLARTIPYSTFSAGFAVLKGTDPVLAVAVFDTRNTPTTSGFEEFFTNGVTVNGQATLPYTLFDRPGHFSVGGTYSSGKYVALDDLPFFVVRRLRGELPPLPRETGSWSVYTLFDQALWVSGADPKRSWGLFGSAGISDGNPNPIRYSTAIGLGGSSPWASRPLDSFGVGYFYVGISEDLKRFAPRLFPLRDEHGVELFYNLGVTPWFHVTPDLQVVTPPRDRAEAALVFGLRAKIDF